MNANLVTVIQFASLIGKAPQQVYGSIRNGAFPQELVEYVAKPTGGTTQPMIKKAEAMEWFVAKEQIRLAKASVQIIYTVDQLLADLMQSNKKGLVTQIQKFIADKN